MSLKLLPASSKDAEEIAACVIALLNPAGASPRLLLEIKNCAPESVAAWNLAGVKAELNAVERFEGEASAVKVVDVQEGVGERITGSALWGWSERASTAIYSEKGAIPLPAGVNHPLRSTAMTQINQLDIDHRPKEAHYELLQLAVSPDYQRRGIGSQLVKWGLEKADRDGVPCCLTATPMGVHVYTKLGFEEVGRVEIPLEPFGGEGTHVHVAMIRRPRRVEQE